MPRTQHPRRNAPTWFMNWNVAKVDAINRMLVKLNNLWKLRLTSTENLAPTRLRTLRYTYISETPNTPWTLSILWFSIRRNITTNMESRKPFGKGLRNGASLNKKGGLCYSLSHVWDWAMCEVTSHLSHDQHFQESDAYWRLLVNGRNVAKLQMKVPVIDLLNMHPTSVPCFGGWTVGQWRHKNISYPVVDFTKALHPKTLARLSDICSWYSLKRRGIV